MTARRSTSETEVPLYLIPHVIARQIKERGEDVFRISVKRTHWHHYNVTVRTKAPNRELRVREERGQFSAREPVTGPGTSPGDDGSGGVA
jgi:hypothetical protein